MTNDRLKDIRKNQQQQHSYEMASRSASVSSSRSNSRGELPTSSGKSFFDATQAIKINIDKVKQNVRDLQLLHRRAVVEVQSSQMEYIKQQISKLTDSTSDLINSTRVQIKGLKQVPGEDAKVKDNQQKQLAKKLIDVASEFQSIQQDAKKGYKQQMERQYRIARPNATAEQVAEALENPNGYVFQQEIMASRVGEQRRLLEDVKARNTDIQKIEKSINEVFQLFQEMQLLLDAQQELVTSIDYHVDQTVTHLEQGTKELSSAIEHAKSARRKKWMLLALILIILAVAAILIYFFIIKPETSKSSTTA